MSDANTLKDQGNKAFAAKRYDEAIDLFTQAIALDPSNHVLYSNRSAAKAGKKLWLDALEDAEQCIKVNPTWAKGYARKGAALHGAQRWEEAIAAYEEGIAIEDSAALQKGLKEVKEAAAAAVGNDEGVSGIAKMFSDPNLFGKLASNPRTSHLLADQNFVNQLKFIQANPSLAGNSFNDPRMISPEPEDEESKEKKRVKAEADAEKAKGAAAYKAKDFEAAEQAFSKAWEISPTDITYLTNLAATYFEKGDYDKCIETCEKAIDEGRSLRADFKLIAKALGRIGTAYSRKDDLDNAIKYFSKSLTEHRTPDILNKLRDAEKLKEERVKQAYIDPELSAKAREEGNAQFKAGDFAASVKSYTESIKRDPNDPRGYNNRAAAYNKLAALPEALKDVETAIKVDPKFVKAYIRKSTILFAMREYTKAMEAAQEATAADTEKQHTREIEQQMEKVARALYEQQSGESDEQTLERAMRDPEVASIMTDPIMQQILQQAQQNPAALQDHMKNPIVAKKIQKLIAAGIIKTRR
ncbi:stress-induced-phosphoprotein 1 [Rhizoctonia solani]|uniref:Stress-induced-phosphoprotein 1 n=1 Tax=Rhizoctonia solani TaxID=456999 RepID=A0A8H8STG3_9AGAM|nr:stress-induced-phosphoprotein 1 [Rhizoctonia solani]QRW16272.1 stress-induced-phosphoprotein 1 [Rhizoctonia solani]